MHQLLFPPAREEKNFQARSRILLAQIHHAYGTHGIQVIIFTTRLGDWQHTSQPLLNNSILFIWACLSAQKPDFCEDLE